MSTDRNNLSPLMRQYYQIKQKYPDTILFFQVGDFYELFFEDAQKVAPLLAITLTQRGTAPQGNPIPLCGVPVHALDHYLNKLVHQGFKVAICDQLELPKPGKVIERGVTQVLTPGTLTDMKLLDAKAASYLCILFPTLDCWGLFFVEILTGQLFVTLLRNTSGKLFETELSRFLPDEIVVPNTKMGVTFVGQLQQLGYVVTVEQFQGHGDILWDEAQKWFFESFSSAQHIFVEKPDALLSGILILYCYLKRTQERSLSMIKQLSVYCTEDFLMLDTATQRNLELVKNTHDNSSVSTLFSVIDMAVTSMGSRTLRKWLLRPLIKQEAIEQRLDAVTIFFNNIRLKENLRDFLQHIGDLERIIGRIALRRAQVSDYLALLKALEFVPKIQQLLHSSNTTGLLALLLSKIDDFGALYTLLSQAINDDTSRQWLIRSGFNAELDRLRLLLEQGTQAILAFERKEQKSTGIVSLKIKHNSVHGYGIEVTKANMHLVPSHYMRIQTLANRERFTTQELKDLEYDLQRAQGQITHIEKEIYDVVRQDVEKYSNMLKKLSYALSYLDALLGLAHVAYNYGYTRPLFNQERNISIKEGFHPVVQTRLKNKFIPNCTNLTDDASLWIITGPNMGGKSTYLRQVALIAILAQIGSFVPAKSACISIVDRIFTRIGAADNVALGKSTFLVEMEETALICNQATTNSLVILDEVGRGTSTFDGLAIAQAVVEYIFEHVKSRCLFATHYHELTLLTKRFNGIASYYAASTRTTEGIVLLHKILPGVADGSFGLEVAKLAQLPEVLVKRAYEILQILVATEQQYAQLQNDQHSQELQNHVSQQISQNGIRQNYNELLQRNQELELYIQQCKKMTDKKELLVTHLAQIDLEQLTAKQALDILWRLKEYIG